MARSELVLGGAGFLGAQLVRELARRGRRVVAASRRPEAMPAEAQASCAAFLSLDGREPGAGYQAIAAGEFACVHLLAALARVGDAERDPSLALRLNRDWPRELAEACARSATPLVFVSTDLVFGGAPAQAPEGYREQDEACPIGPYGASKAAGEAAVLEVFPEALVARLPLLFGDSLGRGLGAEDSLLAALERGERPLLFTDELRAPLDVEDAARALAELSSRLVVARSGSATAGASLESLAGCLHVAGDEAMSRAELGLRLMLDAGKRRAAAWRDAASALAAVRLGTRAELGLAERRAGDARLDSSLARALLASSDPVLDQRRLPPWTGAALVPEV